MILTTTHSVEGYRILHYFHPIAANVVLGTNIISDLVASFSDTFGGRSRTYQEYMDRMYGLAREELSEQATTLGANCVLGISFTPGELSGKGVQMMTLMVTGTPVLIRTPQELESEEEQRQAREIAEETAAAERRERVYSLEALLHDAEIMSEARGWRRMYGPRSMVEFLNRKARELGIDGVELQLDDVTEL